MHCKPCEICKLRVPFREKLILTFLQHLSVFFFPLFSPTTNIRRNIPFSSNIGFILTIDFSEPVDSLIFDYVQRPFAVI